MVRGFKSYSPRTWILRTAIFLLLIFPLFFPLHFFHHFKAHFTGSSEGSVITGEWHIVLISALLFISFLIPLSFRKKISWKEQGIVVAFFISLFVEMYGIPLTIMFISRSFNTSAAPDLDIMLNMRLLGVGFALTLPMVYGSVLMFLGTILIIIGWVTLYRNVKKVGLVTSGIYSISRHPQYLGFLMVIFGWIIGWTTILTIIFGIILFAMYIRVSLKEEKEMDRDHDYIHYKKNTPFML
jgi:protein-S-isoprenylcysteine O-methyltransferase Ste14